MILLLSSDRAAPLGDGDVLLAELEERVADVPDRYRWDYIEALVICRKVGGSARHRTRL